MKVNMPVTDRESLMKEGTILVSTTDLKGKITSVNDEFVRISGFTRSELIGKNHNIVRHPDMPPAAFEDLWQCMKKGLPWIGMVKNRCKNGDYYWVEANVLPVTQNGTVTGYMSVRYAPSRKQISDSEALYRKLNDGSASLKPSTMQAWKNRIGALGLRAKAFISHGLLAIPALALVVMLVSGGNWLAALPVLLLTLAGFAFGISASGSAAKTIDIATKTVKKVMEGSFQNPLEIRRSGAEGGLLQSVYAMQNKLNFDLAESRNEAEVAGRIKKALDKANSNVMLADRDYNIVYLNDTVIEMFEAAQDDLRKDLPEFDFQKLLGSNIDIFHKNPSHQRMMLDKLSDTFESQIIVGGRTFKFIANPVFGDDGERIGTVVEWEDRTSEVAAEEEIKRVVTAVGAGDLSQRLPVEGDNGFFRMLGERVNQLVDTIEGSFNDIRVVLDALAQGDLTQRINNDSQGVYGQVRDNLNSTQEKLKDIFGQINMAADFINTASQEIATGNDNLSKRAEEQASSLEETASGMEEMTSTVQNNAENTRQAKKQAETAQTVAEKGGEVVRNAVDAMDEINASSSKIADIIGVIDEIAFQTNLLALNASVEAARAGEHGRGFAVVATEVRNLAQRSATAAKESKELIQSSVEKVRHGATLVDDSGRTLEEIISSVRKVGDIMAEIAAASDEQSAGIGQINLAVSQMDEITQQNAALAEEASAASISMKEQSDTMIKLMQFFKTEGHGGVAPLQSVETSQSSVPVESKHSVKVASVQPVSQPAAVVGDDSFTSDDEWEEF